MAWIGGADGIFRLRQSDAWCGSLISVEDAAEILGVQTCELSNVPQRLVEGVAYVVELDLHKYWSQGKLSASPFLPRCGNAVVSLDEVILISLIAITLPGAEIEQQVPFGKKRVDLRVRWRGETKLIEFVGPSHFVPGRYQRDMVSPLDRKKAVEDALAGECVIWPNWIQRCARNVSALFHNDGSGLAAVWSTKAFFGDFVYPNSAALVEELTGRFNALAPDGIGYMYGNAKTPNKPVHPIIAKIASGKQTIDRLIPRGSSRSNEWWLPQA
jgi:hypothetical protein